MNSEFEIGAGSVDIRVGTDIQSVAEVESALREHRVSYLDRIFTDHEVDCCGGRSAATTVLSPGLTRRFAAKEATLKVLRPTALVPRWRDIEVVRHGGGWVDLVLTGVAEELADAQQLRTFSLSISHSGGFAVATVIATRLIG
ncbi:MAG: 4'-phosphopantetheinyl transferase superfamily protein [Actinomycetota bacterium]|nr:4'-phosphopantetheinyl transferase superfamily protein [Actinomycetota bacterium]